MTMVRLRADIRNTIIENLMNNKFVEDSLKVQELLDKREELLTNANKLAYEASFTKDQRAILEKYNSAGFFPRADRVMLRIEHEPGNHVDVQAHFGEARPIPFRFYNGGGFTAVIAKDHPYAVERDEADKAYTEWANAAKELRERKFALRRKVEMVMNSVTTVKRLVEVWPEIADYLPEEVSGEQGGLPTYIIEDLNKELGITPKETK